MRGRYPSIINLGILLTYLPTGSEKFEEWVLVYNCDSHNTLYINKSINKFIRIGQRTTTSLLVISWKPI
jgi:hypothetical protein